MNCGISLILMPVDALIRHPSLELQKIQAKTEMRCVCFVFWHKFVDDCVCVNGVGVVVDVVLLIDVYVLIALFIRSDVVLGVRDDDHDHDFAEEEDDELVDLVES